MISRDSMTRFLVLTVTFFLLAGCGGGGDEIIPASGTVTVRITVNTLPASFTYNKTAVDPNQLEYEWGVYFDVNDDGLINTGDIALSLSHYKEDGSAETTGPISAFSARAWLYTTDTAQFLIPGDPVSVSVVANDITLSIDRFDFTNLVGVNATTKLRFRAAYWDPAVNALTYDYYKDLSATVNEPSGTYTDDVGADDSATPNAMIDLQTMQVTIVD